MSGAGVFVDGLLALLLVALGGWAVQARETFAALAGFVGFGLALMLAWVRLRAPDVALTEGAVGGGLSGLLLFGAWSRLRGRAADEPSPPAGRGFRVLVGALCAAVTLLLASIVLRLPESGPTLAPQAHAPLAALGLENPVPAVLMAYRALDTFLEVFVLLLALVGVWSLAGDRAWGGAPAVGAVRHPAPTRLRWTVLAPCAVLALSFAGLPLTGGMVAKLATKPYLADGLVKLLATLSASGSALLMLHFLRRLAALPATESPRPAPAGLVWPWAAAGVAGVVMPWALYGVMPGGQSGEALTAKILWSALWPVLVGAGLALALFRWGRALPAVPEGDVICYGERAAREVVLWSSRADTADNRLRRWPVAGAAALALALALATLMLAGGG